MATLEKIRSKSVLLFVVIIGALLAFILGDFFTNGRVLFGVGNKMIEANGVKVTYDEYQAFAEEHSQDQQGVDNDVLQQQMLYALLDKKLFEKECEAIGLNVTDAELSVFMNDPAVVSDILSQTNFPSTEALLGAIADPAKYKLTAEDAQQLRRMWIKREDQVQETIQQTVFQFLLNGLYGANTLDSKIALADNANIALEMAVVDATIIPDSDVKVSDEDLAKLYDDNESKFMVEEDAASVSLIAMPIVPSEEDIEAARAKAIELKDALAASDNVDLSQYATSRKTVSVDALNRAMGNSANRSSMNFIAGVRNMLADSAAAPGLTRVVTETPDYYQVAKILNMSQKKDQASVSVLMFSEELTPDSALMVAQAYPNWKELTTDSVYAGKFTAGVNAHPVSLVERGTTMNTQRMPADLQMEAYLMNQLLNLPKFTSALENAQQEQAFLFTDTINETPLNIIYRLDAIQEPVNVAEVLRVDVVTTPSAATGSAISNKVRNYAANNSDSKTFNDNAEKAALEIIREVFTPSTPTLFVDGQPISGTRPLIKWALENKKGKVSPVVNGKIAAAPQSGSEAFFASVRRPTTDVVTVLAVNNRYDAGDEMKADDPYTKAQLSAAALNAKKAAKRAEELKGKGTTVAEYAAQANVPARNTSEIFFSTNLPAEIISAIAAAKEGEVVGPLAGSNGRVYVFKVNGTEPSVETEDVAKGNFVRRFSPFTSGAAMHKALVGKHKVKNHSTKQMAGLDD